MSSPELFDTAVIDSNFFIALVETGLEKTILPILQEKLPIDSVMPYELPHSDIPKRFRDLRRILPKYIKGIKVNRESSFWVWSSELAQRLHFIRAKDDPADIDVVVLARLLEKQKGKNVTVVSNDEGVIRMIREVIEFQNIKTMSSGSFLFTLSAMVDDEKLSTTLTDAGDKLYNQYLSYRRKSRKFIDIKSLVAELKDTSIYIRNASKSTAQAVVGQPVVQDNVQGDGLKVDEFGEIISITNNIMNYRDTFNLLGGEEYLYSLAPNVSELLGNATSSDAFRMMVSMFIGEVYSFRTWAMDVRLRTGGVFEASMHAENLLMVMNFMRVNKEIIEDVLALQSLLVLLNGNIQHALAISRQIPKEEEMSSAQIMSMICALISQNTEADIHKAEKLFAEYAIEKQIVDRDGLVNSLLKFSNTLYLFDNHNLAHRILRFLLVVNGNQKNQLMQEVAYRLFLVTRLNPELLDNVCNVTVMKLVEKSKLVDETSKKIQPAWKKIKELNGADDDSGPLLGSVIILNQNKPFDKPHELHVIGFEENTRSTWRYVFPIDYAPSLDDALGFKLKGGDIKKIVNKTVTDPAIRGTLYIENPAFQVDLQIHLE